MTPSPLAASFRDPSGFVYSSDGVVYRQVNRSYQGHYDSLMNSGLYDALVTRGWLVRHEEVSIDGSARAGAYRVIKPERIPYISYPYEWCFSELKNAALLTLDIQMLSLSLGMTLKDASAYNVQFVGHRPVFIDTLSFERYEDGAPWVAYRQFCQHFLAPLALMVHADRRIAHLLRRYVDGIPLDLATRLLPPSSRFRFGLLIHIHAHARSQARHQHDGRYSSRVKQRLPKSRLIALVDSLRGTVRRLTLPHAATEWSAYYQDTNYSDAAMAAKESAVQRMIETYSGPLGVIHDLGANTGRFSRLLVRPGRYVVSHDVDEMAVEGNYLRTRAKGVDGVLPLVLDLTNPSPSLGWALTERTSSLDRLSGGTVAALALIHHIAISNNVPLPRIAEFFAAIGNTLLIEFVPKEDSQVQRLLATRKDIFPDYTQEAFETAFAPHFRILEKQSISGSARMLFAMRRHG